jgi:hypothetical protein
MLRLILLQNLGMHFDPTVLLLISEHTVPPDWVFALAPFLCISGVFLHFVSDAQKFFVLQLRKGVVQDGLFVRTRNRNYLSEVRRICGRFLALATSPRARRSVPILCPQYAPERQVDVPLSCVRCLQRSDGDLPAFAEYRFYAATVRSAGFCNSHLNTISTHVRHYGTATLINGREKQKAIAHCSFTQA